MEQDFVLRITNEINRQIYCGVEINVVMSWGVSRRTATVYNDMATLALRVNAILHKGWVYVSLDEGRDCYIITLLSNDRKTVVGVRDEVYCEELGSVIDNLIERKEEWTDDDYEKMFFMEYEKQRFVENIHLN